MYNSENRSPWMEALVTTAWSSSIIETKTYYKYFHESFSSRNKDNCLAVAVSIKITFFAAISSDNCLKDSK